MDWYSVTRSFLSMRRTFALHFKGSDRALQNHKLRFYCGLKFQSDLLENEHSEQQQQQQDNYILRILIWHVM